MLKLRFFGVGDGDCILIELPDGRFALVDSCRRPGGGTSAALDALRGKQVAFCCLTHPHADHFAGMLELLDAADVVVEKFWYALSDLDDVVPLWNATPVRGGQTSVARGRREREIGELIDLFLWIWAQPPGFDECITGVQCRRIGEVEILLFGPDPMRWKRYRQALAKQRVAGRPLKRKHANPISLCILLRYYEHRVWLLGDLTRAPMRQLAARARSCTPARSDSELRASVLKVPHHGSSDACFPGMSEALTRCEGEDVVVITATGVHHPADSVLKYWQETGKRLCKTWIPPSEPSRGRLGGWASDAIDQVARPGSEWAPCDVVLSLPKQGPVEIAYALPGQ